MTLPKEKSPLITQFLAFLKEQGFRSIPTYKAQMKALERWLWLRRIQIENLTFDHLSRYLTMRKERGNTSLTLERTRTVFRTFCRFASHHNLLPPISVEQLSIPWLGEPGNYPAYQGVFRKCFKAPAAIRRYTQLPFAKELGDFTATLLTDGYPRPQRWCILRSNFHFQRYLLARKKSDLITLTPKDIETFLRTQPIASTAAIKEGMRGDITRFLKFVFERQGRIFPPPPPPDSSEIGRLIREHNEFTRVHRGLRSVTIEAHDTVLKRFQKFLSRRGIRHVRDIAIVHLDAFSSNFPSYQPRSLKGIMYAVRSFLRFLYLHRHIGTDLASQLYPPSVFSADRRPKYIPWEKVQQFLATIDRSSHLGKRHHAVLILLASYGLRPEEVSRLRCDDIDFQNRRLYIRERKNQTDSTLPLRPEVEEALTDYLRVRPSSSYPHLFLRSKAPFRPLAPNVLLNAISGLLTKAFGNIVPRQGAYSLRHSFAKAMLDRGAPLTDIGAVLGHRCLTSTLIYTRVHTKELRQVADNYGDLL